MSEEEYNTFLLRSKQNQKYARTGTKRTRKPLAGILKCAFCHANLGVSNIQVKNYYFRHNNIKCEGFKGVRVDRIEKPLIKKLSERSQEISEMVSLPEISINPEILELQENLRELNSLYEKIPSDHLLKAIREIEEKLSELFGSENYTQPVSEDLIKSLSNIDFWEGLSESDRKLVYTELVEAIYVKNSNEIEIVLKF